MATARPTDQTMQHTPLTPPPEPELVALPPSYAQELLWLMDRASPGSSAYNVPRTRRLVGPLDVEALRRAFDAIVERHEILRTTYAFHDDHTVQVIHPPRRVGFSFVDLRALPVEQREADAARRARELASRPFDLAADLLLRVAVMRIGDADHVLHIDSHHVAFDGWSRDILFRELAAFYAEFAGGTPAALPALPIQYADYAIWEREQLSGERLERLVEWWRDRLAGAEFVLDVPTDYARPAVPSIAGVTERIVLPPELSERVRRLGQAHDATLYMTLLAAISTVLHRYTGQADVLVGSPIAGRSRPETESLLGYFANTIVQRASFAGDPTFAELLDRVREHALGAYDHQEIPFEKLVLELQGGQQLSYSPLFQVVFTMLGGGGDARGGRIGEAEVRSFGADDGVTKFDLTFFMTDRPDGVVLTLRGRADLFAQATMARTLGHVRTVLEHAVAAPDTRVSDIRMLTDAEAERIASWNATTVDAGATASMVDLIAAQTVRVPTRVAVMSGSRSVTYAELDRRANQLAHRLRALGVQRDMPVGVALERSVDVVVAILGILKAGGAYVPLLPEVPVARLSQQISECGATVVVTVADYATRVPDSATLVCLDRDEQSLSAEPNTAPDIVIDPDGLAYVLYTSGSTGVPKGVGVTHRNIVHYTRAVSRVLGDVPAGTPGDGLAALDGWHFGMTSSLGADLGNTALFPALAAGATLHVLHADITTDPARYAEYLSARPLDVVKITPNHLRALLASRAPAEVAGALPRRWIVLGGEPLGWEFAERLMHAGACRVLNHYGPTETTVGVSTFEVTDGSARIVRAAGAATVPIGRPLANTGLHALDAHRHPVPVGVPGELYVSGAGVSAGYVNRPAQTADRFVHVQGIGRTYRTGDRVRRLATGELEFLGRGDDQVKIRGYRVELGEIEHVLSEHPGVAQCVALLRDQPHASGSDVDPVLAAYVVLRDGGSRYAKAYTGGTMARELEEWVGARLPEYMVPTVVLVDRIPLGVTGKIDRASLPDPVGASGQPQRVEPRTETERDIAAIWAEVLKKDDIGVTDNFIALGGHSLLAIRVLGKLSRRFGVRLPLRTLFDAPTIAELAELVDMEVKLAALENLSDEEAARLLAAHDEGSQG